MYLGKFQCWVHWTRKTFDTLTNGSKTRGFWNGYIFQIFFLSIMDVIKRLLVRQEQYRKSEFNTIVSRYTVTCFRMSDFLKTQEQCAIKYRCKFAFDIGWLISRHSSRDAVIRLFVYGRIKASWLCPVNNVTRWINLAFIAYPQHFPPINHDLRHTTWILFYRHIRTNMICAITDKGDSFMGIHETEIR